jgi:hypothetical protein
MAVEVAREIGDAEASAFRHNGWALLRGLVTADHAAVLLEDARRLHERASRGGMAGTGRLEDFWYTWDGPLFQAREMRSGPLHELTLSREMGALASRLIGRQRLTDRLVPIRSMGGLLYCKTGSGTATSKAIQFHQDGPSFHADRAGLVTIWLALDEVTPQQGAMRFLEGSHREGSLGNHRTGFPVDRYPGLLKEYCQSPPLHYAAGDATAHDGFILHASPENTTDKPRWGYLSVYIADDVEFDDSEYGEFSNKPMGFGWPLERYPVVHPAT